jgi:hypothetical protein
MTTSKPTPKREKSLRCTCPRNSAGEWMRDIKTGEILIDPQCAIHARRDDRIIRSGEVLDGHRMLKS